MKIRNFVRFTTYLAILAILVGVGWSLVVPTFGNGHQVESRITWIIDGDTFVIERRIRVRLIGIDAPETASSKKLERLVRNGHNKDSIIVLADAALKYCIKHFKGKTVRLERDGVQPDKDQYGRLLRYLYQEDGTCINEELIRMGFALVYRRADFDSRVEFLAAEEDAKAAGLGIWAQR